MTPKDIGHYWALKKATGNKKTTLWITEKLKLKQIRKKILHKNLNLNTSQNKKKEDQLTNKRKN